MRYFGIVGSMLGAIVVGLSAALIVTMLPTWFTGAAVGVILANYLLDRWTKGDA
jgi:hypothetical protein